MKKLKIKIYLTRKNLPIMRLQKSENQLMIGKNI
jgi:hypothetical protein